MLHFDYILLCLAKTQLLILLGLTLILTASAIWEKSSKLFLSVRYYFEWRPTIRAFAEWKQHNKEVIMLTTEGKRVLEMAVDHLDGRYQFRLIGTKEFVADELVRTFDLPRTVDTPQAEAEH